MIEHDVPMPKKRGKASKWADMADKMNVGDSVRVSTRGQASCLSSAINTLYRGSCESDSAAAMRAVENGTFRVWRIK